VREIGGRRCTCNSQLTLFVVKYADLLEHYFPNAKVYVYDFDSAANANPLLGPYVVNVRRLCRFSLP
jgi:hypothetical protein